MIKQTKMYQISYFQIYDNGVGDLITDEKHRGMPRGAIPCNVECRNSEEIEAERMRLKKEWGEKYPGKDLTVLFKLCWK